MKVGSVVMVLFGMMGVARAKPPTPEHAFKLMNEWRIDEAADEVAALVAAHPHDPDVQFVEGDLLFLRGDYEGAVKMLDQAAERTRPGPDASAVRDLRALAQATAEATRGFVATRGKHFVIWHAPGKDALLAPYALAALEKAYQALGDDFGDRPREPVRVEIYPEVADLAKVSTLTLKEIETSGTIALCKYNRVMIVSPRALLTGYPWLDTLNHEYTHFIVSRTSHNTVPIWLHEGLAKFEERRWRGTHDQTGGLTPSMEHLLAKGLAQNHFITFEQMHPSMAKLPSQEDTALAFAEVYMVVQYLSSRVGWSGIRKVISGMKSGDSDAQAVAQVVGEPFGAFQKDFRGWLKSRKLKSHPGLEPTALKFKKGNKSTAASQDDSSDIREERARKLARLGGMLRARHRLRAAAIEYEKAQAIVGPGNPQVGSKLARTWLELDDPARAIDAALPVLALYPDQAGPNATLGEAWLKKGDLAKAEPFLDAAIAISPFDPAPHCGLSQIYAQRKDPRADRESEDCRALGGGS